MKFYSEVTGKTYDVQEECLAAEEKALKAREEEKLKKERDAADRKAMAAEVEEARKAMAAAQKVYKEKLEAFVNKYHSYHYSTTKIEDIPSLFNLFDKYFL